MMGRLAIEATMNVLGKGVYTIAEGAKLTRLRPSRVREWFKGRESPSRISTPIFQSDYPVLLEEYAISFLDLIELNIGGNLREAGISLPKLRVNYHELRKEFGNHPFCTRQIYVRGKQVFTSGLNEKDRGSVIEAMTKKMYFDKIILPFLKEIHYDKATEQAARWHIADLVVVDPAIRFGKPVVEGTGMSTAVLRNSYYANGEDAKFVAGWFGVEERHVMAAVEFENRLAA